MNKKMIASFAAAGIATGIICVIYFIRKRNAQTVQLDFMEYALGGH